MASENQDCSIGLISDTHGLLRPEAVHSLRNCLAILHAGDICDPEIIEKLGEIAPVYFVAGNMDRHPAWPRDETFDLKGHTFHILHDLSRLDLDPRAAGIEVVVFGHTHRPEAFLRDTVLYINPGSAGPRRGNLPVSVARLTFERQRITPEFIEID